MKKNYPQSCKNLLKINGFLSFNGIAILAKKALFFITLFFATQNIYSQSPYTDNTPGGSETFIVPTGVTSITVSVWGAGGGGGGCNSSGDGGSGGGGGGATTRVIAVTPGDTFTYNVGIGGAGGLSTAGIGVNGTNSTFVNGGLGINMIGNFGTGGGPNRGGVGIGGNSSGGTTNLPGQNGIVGNTSGQAGGASGAVVGIFGFGGAAVTNSAGNPGTIPGGGGGGGERDSKNRAGGNGANGQIRITFTCPIYTVNAGIDQTLVACATTATLNGSAIPVGTTGTWTLVSGAATITNPNLANTGITGLVPGTPATLRWNISNGTCGITSDDVIITPVAGGGCVPYCIPNYTAQFIPITNVTFAGINNNTSGTIPAASNYDIFYSPTAIVEQGETYNLSVSGLSNGNFDYYDVAYFDWNQDGDFLDAGEGFAIGIINTSTTGPNVTRNIQIPLTALTGTTRMRIMHLRGTGTYSTSCQTGALRGQVEDYLVNIQPVSCKMPTAVTSSAITATTATISWTAPVPAPSNGYDYYISTINVAPSTFYPFTTPTGSVGAGVLSTPLTGLTPATIYYVFIRGNCGSGDTSIWTVSSNFTTTLSNNDCAGAITIPINSGTNCEVATEGSTRNATASAEVATTCAGTEDDDVWFKFVATAVNHRITVVPGNSPTLNEDFNFQVFSDITGNCGTKTSTGCAVTAAAATETQLFSTIIGVTYFVRVYTSTNLTANRGSFTICVTTGNATHSSNSAAPASYVIHPTAGFSNRNIHDFNTTGPMANITNLATRRYITGYKDYTSLSPAVGIQNGGINIDIYLAQSRQYLKAWVDWNNDGTFTDTAAEIVYTSNSVQSIATSFGFVIPAATPPGIYKIRVRSHELVQAYLPYGYLENGETEDYMIQVITDCTAKITSVTDNSVCDSGTVNLSATASGAPSQFRWYANETGGAPLATTATGNWTTPSLTTTTTYWVTAFNGCESLLRTKIIATVYPTSIIYVTPSVPEVCGENNVVSVTAAGDFIISDLINEKFEGAGLGTMTGIIIGGAGDVLTQWQKKTSTYVPVGSVWKPAINSRETGNGFAFSTSDYNLDVNVSLQSATFDTTTFTDLTLEFRHYYSYYGVPYDGAFVEVSTDGGTIWNPIVTYKSDQAVASKFDLVSINMSAYINQPTLSIRFRYNAKFCDGWAVDDVRLFGKTPLNTTFSWSGGTVDAYIDGACTIPYTAQSVSTVFVKPTPAQLSGNSWSFTATATLANGCPVSKLITIDNRTKLWKGTVSDDWYNPNNWSPTGVPDANTCVIIYDGPSDSKINNTSNDAYAKYVIVRPFGDLQVFTNNDLTITDNLNIEAGGNATFENSSSLIQISNIANTGNITYKRTANIRKQDYVYWSAPVAGFSNSAVSPGTSLGLQYKWLPTTAGVNNFGNWTLTNEIMTLGKGYCLRGPDSFPSTVLTDYTASFIGVPNNGDINMPISRGTFDGVNYLTGVSTTLGTKADDNWNLVGNPFPSAINAISFLTLNTNIDGFVNIWTHGTLPSTGAADPFYNDYAYNYTPSDYITYNLLGASSGPGTFNGFINAGQGFFVSMLHTTAGTTENLIFNNSLRSNTYNNNKFYRTSENKNVDAIETHKIWFDLIGPSGNNIRSLIGYAENATNGKDRLFDAFSNEKVSFNIFSLIGEEKMLIQGRQLPFDNNDKVNLGVTIPQDGLYKIALSNIDGLFSDVNQNIYLEDKLLNVIYNLKEAPYSFIAKKGTTTDRFIMRFTKEVKEKIIEVTNQLTIYDNKELTVESSKLKIKTIEIFDILGKRLFNKNEINTTVFGINNLIRNNSLIIIKTTLEDNSEEVRKVMY